jgi:hypothetical protein
VRGWPVPLRDGHRLLVSTNNGELRLFDRGSGKIEPVLALDPDEINLSFSLSRDEKWIYFTVSTDESDVWLAELR